MAIAFRVTDSPPTDGSIQASGLLALQAAHRFTIMVEAYDDGGGDVNPAEVTEMQVAQEVGPIVNRDVFTYTQSATRYVIPWLICSGKTVERNLSNRAVFRVTVEYRTGQHFQIVQEDLAPIEAPANLDGYPVLRETLWQDQREVIYEEPTHIDAPGPPPEPKKQLRLPTGNLYSEPFRQRFVSENLRQLQFEPFGSHAEVENIVPHRLYTVNRNDYAGSTRGFWMITDLAYQKVRLPTTTGNVDGFLMVYTITRSVKPGGWYDRRALVDNIYLKNAADPPDLSEKIVARDEGEGLVTVNVLLNEDGTKKDPQTGDYTWIDYHQQPLAAWDWLK